MNNSGEETANLEGSLNATLKTLFAYLFIGGFGTKQSQILLTQPSDYWVALT